tara:strand:+ start:18075 stop:19019 length:945 start_codon:yes stop_codon:yes gene_type:complete
MRVDVEQRALLALELLLTRPVSMTKATQLALTTPTTLKKYLKMRGIKWAIKNYRFTILKTPAQKRYEMIDLMNNGESATAAAKSLETTVKTMSKQTLPDKAGTEQPILTKGTKGWTTDFIKVEDYSLVYYGSVSGLSGTILGRGQQKGPKATTEEGDEDYMDIWWQIDFNNWSSTLPPSLVGEFWKPEVMQVLRSKLETFIITDLDLAKSFLGNSKVSAHAASTGRISATGDLDLTRLEQIIQRYEVKMMRDVSAGVDDNLIFRVPSYDYKSDLGPETSKGAFQVMFLNKDDINTYPKSPENIDVVHNLADENL